MKPQREKKLEIALLKEKIERISGKKVVFKEKENILVPRNLDTRDEKYKQKILKLLQQKVYDGDLDLSNLPFELENLGNLERVNGDLNLESTLIPSLGNLEYVNGFLNLFDTPVKDLNKLKRVNVVYISRDQEEEIKGLEKFNYDFW